MPEIPDTMRAVDVVQPGPPDMLHIVTRATPAPRAGEVLIRVEAAGVNYPDVLQRRGQYVPPPGASDLIGLEVAGTIVRVGDGGAAAGAGADAEAEADAGEDGDRGGRGGGGGGLRGGGGPWSVGDRVCALLAGGGYAEYCVAPAPQVLPMPAGLTPVEAASLPEVVCTVWANVFDRGALRPGETFLVHGGSSGIGTAAIQLARAHGARVLATAGSAEKVRACAALGAARAINYHEEDFVSVVEAETEGRGVDVILDMVGGDYLPRNLACLAMDGRLVEIAYLRGRTAPLDLALVLRKRATITGSLLRPRSVEQKGVIARAVRERVWPWIEQGLVRPVVHATFPLADAASAHRLLESSTHIGKIVLTVP